MSKTRIYFDASADLTNACRWAYNPDKDAPKGAAQLYVLLQQVTETHCAIVSKSAKDVWFYRYCPAQGPIGTTLLLDAQEWLSRIGNKNVWRRRNICLSTTKSYKVSVEAISGVEDNTIISAGNITIPLYPGDLGDFELPPEVDWQHAATINQGWEFKTLCSVVNTFSALSSDNTNKGLYFRFQDNTLSIHASEKGGNRGISLISAEMQCSSKTVRFGVEGRHLLKLANLFTTDGMVTVELDDLEEPTLSRFSGENGWIILPIIEDYLIQDLSRGAMAMFHGEEDFKLTEHCSRVYPLVDLSDNIEMQEPLDSKKSRELLLEEVENDLVDSKIWDANKLEAAKTPTWSIVDERPWRPVSVGYDYLSDALKALDKHMTYVSKQQEFEEGEVPTDFDFDDGEEWSVPDSPNNQVKLVMLTLMSAVTALGIERWFLFLKHPTFSGCQISISCGLPEYQHDQHETD